MNMLSELDDWVVQSLLYLGAIVSGVVLLSSGWTHLATPLHSLLGGWLQALSIPVANGPALSLGGVAALIVMAVGLMVLLSGLAVLVWVPKQLLDL